MKILIMTCKFGMGHYIAAKNLEEKIEQSDLEAQSEVVDFSQIVLGDTSRWFYAIYKTVIGKTSRLYYLIYKNTLNADGRLERVLKTPQKYIEKKLETEIHRHNPDVIISTYSLASHFLAEYKYSRKMQTPLITCVTDLSAHEVWIHENTDYYLVATQQTKKDLINRGIDARSISVFGIPVSKKYEQGFVTESKKVPARRGKKKELLMMGGGLGLLPTNMEFYRKLDHLPNLHSTIICGENKRLYRRLVKEEFKNIEIQGFCHNVSDYMQRADILISKPGGLTTFEAIYAEVPLLSFAPYLPQERTNAAYIVSQEMGCILPKKTEDILTVVQKIAENKELLKNYRTNMRQAKQCLVKTALVEFLCQAERRVYVS